MQPLDRRQFLTIAAASTIAGPCLARTLKTVGVQLYTVRSIISKDPLEVLRSIEKIGYREIEATAQGLDKISAALKETSLKGVSLHLDTGLFLRQPEKLPAALEDAKQRGFQYVVCPYIAPADRGGPEVMRKLADSLNKAGAESQKMGLRLCYHNHAFEYEQTPSGTLLDVLMQATDPKLVSLELDVMWAKVAGVDPVSVVTKYGHRIALVHLKDLASGVDQRYNEGIPREAFREVGHGVIDFKAVLQAAQKAGVQHYFVEQDQTPGDPIDSLRQSFQYLEKLNY